MNALNHALSGAIIAVLVPAPLIPLVAVATHFVLDAFPHAKTPDNIRDALKRPFAYIFYSDIALTFAATLLAWYLFPDKLWLILLGVTFAILPDLLWFFNGKVAWLKPYFKFALWIQWAEKPWGWSLEILYSMIFVVVLIGLS